MRAKKSWEKSSPRQGQLDEIILIEECFFVPDNLPQSSDTEYAHHPQPTSHVTQVKIHLT